MSSIKSLISKIEKDLNALKISMKKESKKKEQKKKVIKKIIDDVKKKSDLKKFTVAELKEWIKKNNINTKKLEKLHKDDWINIVWKTIKKNSESSSDSESEYSSTSSSCGSSCDDVDSDSDSD